MIEALIARALATFAGHGLKVAAVVALATAVGTWDWRRIHRAEERGRQEVRVEIERKTDENVLKAERARSGVEQLPAGRLRDKWCRDC